MIWELSGDDSNGSLLTGMSTQLRNDNSGLHSVWLPLPWTGRWVKDGMMPTSGADLQSSESVPPSCSLEAGLSGC